MGESFGGPYLEELPFLSYQKTSGVKKCFELPEPDLVFVDVQS